MPVYNKPMIYYPLTTLMLAGIRDVLVITTPSDSAAFKQLLSDGEQWGMNISYASQEIPNGLAQAFVIGKDFVDGGPSALILGDNLYYGHGLPETLGRASEREVGATVFAQKVVDPQSYGIVEFDARGRAISIEEKPANPRSSYAVTGLYFYDGEVCNHAAKLKPSKRGEYEITDLNRGYLEEEQLTVEILGRGYAWLDTGTHESLLEAGTFVQTIEKRQGLMIACPEEIAFQQGFIDSAQLCKLAERPIKSAYGAYLKQLAENVLACRRL